MVTLRSRVARLTPEGLNDFSFNWDIANGAVRAIAAQPDGTILIGGFFTSVNRVPRNYIARLRNDGTIDTSFQADIAPGAFNTVYAIAPLDDGRIVIGGIFTTIGGLTRINLARLNANGSVDTSFIANTDNTVYTIALQQDGKPLSAAHSPCLRARRGIESAGSTRTDRPIPGTRETHRIRNRNTARWKEPDWR